MKHLSSTEFSSYIGEEGIKYIYNPQLNIAYRGYDKDNVGYFFAKTEGGEEKQIRHDDDGFNKAWMFAIVMSKEEYNNF